MIKRKNIFVTGATGFLGFSLVEKLKDSNNVYAFVRKLDNRFSSLVTQLVNADKEMFKSQLNLNDIDVVIHTAARVHVMDDKSADSLSEFRKINVEGTLGLAKQAALAGVKRFIFISSIKVNGESTSIGRPYFADDIPAPADPYGISKMEAEQGLLEISSTTDMEIVIIRPVLIYGPGVKANFSKLMSLICKEIPLPLGAISNKRSFVSLDNLIDLIVTCIDHENAANQIFLVSDGEDLSTPELLRLLASALGRNIFLIPIPEVVIKICFKIFGKATTAERLCGSLQVEITKTRELLGWVPPVRVENGLKKTANYFIKN